MRKFLVMLLAFFFLSVPAVSPGAAPIVARIDIVDGISGLTAQSVHDQLEEAKKVGATRLEIVINSPGGDVGAGLAIIGELRASNIPTVCTVGQMAASMAAIILESNACGERVVNPTSAIMFHGVQTTVQGDQRTIENDLAALAALNKVAANIVGPRIGMTPERYFQLIVNESRVMWFVGADAVKANIADRVIPTPPPAQ